MNIEEMVSARKQVHFVRYQHGELWYAAESGFEFPVPVADAGTAEFKAEDKALRFMRWTRKHVEMLEAARPHPRSVSPR
jgi:hypothetical protein